MSTDINVLVDDAIDTHIDTATTATIAPTSTTYVDAIPVASIEADLTYQRPLDRARVNRMAAEYDPSLVGVLEVSLREDGTYYVVDGQHRLAMVVQVRGSTAHVVCNVHTGLTPEQEAQLFFDIDRKRRRLTGWDRWNARRGAGEQIVVDIEATAALHGLSIDPAPKVRHLRCVTACEKLVQLGGLDLLDETLRIGVAAYAGEVDSLRAEIVHGTGLVLHAYSPAELDRDVLIRAMQGIAPRQVGARAAALRETQNGRLPRLAAHVLVDRYNGEPGVRVEPFLKRTAKKPGAKT